MAAFSSEWSTRNRTKRKRVFLSSSLIDLMRVIALCVGTMMQKGIKKYVRFFRKAGNDKKREMKKIEKWREGVGFASSSAAAFLFSRAETSFADASARAALSAADFCGEQREANPPDNNYQRPPS